MAGNLKRKIDDVCPLCSGTVKSYQLSFEDTFVMCSQVNCPYPFEEEKQADSCVNSSTTDIRYAKSNDSLLSVSNTVDDETVDSDNKDRPKKKVKYTSKPCTPKLRSPKTRSPKPSSSKPRSPASVNNANNYKPAASDSVPDTTMPAPVDTLVSPTHDDFTLDSLLESFYTTGDCSLDLSPITNTTSTVYTPPIDKAPFFKDDSLFENTPTDDAVLNNILFQVLNSPGPEAVAGTDDSLPTWLALPPVSASTKKKS